MSEALAKLKARYVGADIVSLTVARCSEGMSAISLAFTDGSWTRIKARPDFDGCADAEFDDGASVRDFVELGLLPESEAEAIEQAVAAADHARFEALDRARLRNLIAKYGVPK